MSSVVDRVLLALNAHDLDALVACYSAQATIEDGRDQILSRGHQEMRSRTGAIMDTYPQFQVQALGRWSVGSFVVQEEQVTGRSAVPERHIAIYELENEVIVRERLLR